MWTPPSSRKTFSIRPLDKGMVTSVPSQLIDDGALTVGKGIYCSPKGAVRFPGSTAFAAGQSLPYTPEDYITVWGTDGVQRNLLLTQKTLFRIDPDLGYTEVPWDYSDGTVTVSGNIVTGAGTAWTTSDIYPGDILRIGSYEATIENVGTDTSISIKDSNIPDQSGAAYKIQRAFGSGDKRLLDWCLAEGYLLIADGKRPLICYDPTANTFSYWMNSTAKMPQNQPVVPTCVCYYGDRVWIGDILSSADGTRRQRQYFSKLADTTDFSTATNYIDLPYTSSEIRKMMPMGDNLVVYFGDMIFIGSPTSYPTAPVKYEKVETASIGLVGRRAVCDIDGAHLFIGQDDVYAITSSGINQLKCPIRDFTIYTCKQLWRIYAIVDSERKCALIGFPRNEAIMEKIAIYDLETKAWTYIDLDTYMLANPYIQRIIAIDALTGTIDGLDTTYQTIDAMGEARVDRYIFHEGVNKIWRISADITEIQDSQPIQINLETKDFDFDDPDNSHLACRLGLKIDYDLDTATPVSFLIQGSTDRGRIWKTLGTLTIPYQHDEGHVDFRLSGETLRFRITSSADVSVYTITELTIDIRAAGSDRSLRLQK